MESRRAILHAAANLATTRGLEGLSIGELAQHIGMSKSGLYAHFKSKEELELATIETAAEIFEREVLAPAGESPGGLGAGVGPGRGVPRAPGAAGVPGRVLLRDRLGAARVAPRAAPRPGDGLAGSAGSDSSPTRWARPSTAGELPRDADIDQLVFEVTAMLVRANFAWVVTGDPQVLDQARTGIRHALERAAGQQRPQQPAARTTGIASNFSRAARPRQPVNVWMRLPASLTCRTFTMAFEGGRTPPHSANRSTSCFRCLMPPTSRARSFTRSTSSTGFVVAATRCPLLLRFAWFILLRT